MKTGDQEWLTLMSWKYPTLFGVSEIKSGITKRIEPRFSKT